MLAHGCFTLFQAPRLRLSGLFTLCNEHVKLKVLLLPKKKEKRKKAQSFVVFDLESEVGIKLLYFDLVLPATISMFNLGREVSLNCCIFILFYLPQSVCSTSALNHVQFFVSLFENVRLFGSGLTFDIRNCIFCTL